MWGSSQVIQFDATGKKSQVIELPVTHPTSCCFGGPQLSTLFITTSKHVLTADEIQQQPLAGKILQIETAFKGQVMRRFKG
jgi:sugar lactone lactonase YvrE